TTTPADRDARSSNAEARSRDRACSATSWPSSMSARAAARPRPSVLPVTKMRATTDAARLSSHPQRGVQRIEQGGIAERLEEALHSALGEQPRPDGLVTVAGDEHDRNRVPPTYQFLLKLGSRHPGHRNVEDQTFSLRHELRGKERIGRR